MESLKIKSSKVSLAINDDESRIIEFNPGDVAHRKAFYSIFSELEEKGNEISKKEQMLSDENRKEAELELEEELFDAIAEDVDKLFGEGTISKITEGAKDCDLLIQFMYGITPYYQQYAESKLGKQVPKKSNKKVMK